LLSIAATLAVAAIAGLAKLIHYMLDVHAADRQARFDQRQEVARLTQEAEARISARVERVEAQLFELRLRITRTSGATFDDGNSVR
jgi:TolA-binding protein